MSSGNPALSLDEVFLSPQALEPPPIRRALFIFLLLLTALLHLATIGWGDLYNETDGQYAGRRARNARIAAMAHARRMTASRARKSRPFFTGRSPFP